MRSPCGISLLLFSFKELFFFDHLGHRDSMNLLSLSVSQALAMKVNVGEGHVDDKSRFVLREAPVSHFAKAKDVLNHSKDVFHSAADTGLRPVALSVLITEWPVPMTLALGKVFRFASFAVYPLLLTTICTVTINPLLFPMKKALDDSRVMHVGRGDFHGVHHLALTVSSDVTFHPKVPFIAFLGLMHLRIAFSFFVSIVTW